jgi:aerobic-type carbon monoxide dehydrogenase small subunit (CoxS/CutS family)
MTTAFGALPTISLELNGSTISLACAPGERLLETLRKQGLWSVKHGCESGECGACTVLVDGQPRVSCLLLTVQLEGRSVTTVEALGTPDALHPLQQAFLDCGAVQCGFCTPGMLLAAKALLDHHPVPTRHDAAEALSGNLCRCTGYRKPIEAVVSAASRMREQADQAATP